MKYFQGAQGGVPPRNFKKILLLSHDNRLTWNYNLFTASYDDYSCQNLTKKMPKGFFAPPPWIGLIFKFSNTLIFYYSIKIPLSYYNSIILLLFDSIIHHSINFLLYYSIILIDVLIFWYSNILITFHSNHFIFTLWVPISSQAVHLFLQGESFTSWAGNVLIKHILRLQYSNSN